MVVLPSDGLIRLCQEVGCSHAKKSGKDGARERGAQTERATGRNSVYLCTCVFETTAMEETAKD